MALQGITYQGPEVDDLEIAAALPDDAKTLLEDGNGFVAFAGGLHVRGACRAPLWHSLREAWWSEQALHRRYDVVAPSDVPIAQDAVGDQWVIRDGKLWRLEAETGTMEATNQTLDQFLHAAEKSPVATLGLEPLMQFNAEGHQLRPGELISVYPPFCTEESAQGVSLRAVPAQERLDFLAEFARQIPAEGKFQIRLE